MPIKRHKPEEIIAKLRRVDVLVSQGSRLRTPFAGSALPKSHITGGARSLAG